MSSIKISALWLSLLFTSITASSAETMQIGIVHSSESTAYFVDRKVILSYPSIKNNKLVFGACYEFQGKDTLDCIFSLSPSPAERNVKDQRCEVMYSAEKGRLFGKGFEMKLLFEDKVLLMWLELDEADARKEPHVVLRVMDMRDCSFEKVRISSDEATDLDREFVGCHTVVYNNTFDVFFRKRDLCGDMMCGQTHDAAGKIINGPVPSYLPARFFEENTYVCPVQPGSSTLGHFLISSKFRLISSRYGEIRDLMDYPSRVASLAFSCDSQFLGFCWVEHVDSMHVNCSQFDSQGKLVMATKLNLGYRRGLWMSMKNLAEGGLLLQTTMCDDDSWCADNVDRLSFFAHKIDKNGQVENLHEINDVSCNSNLRTDIDELPDGNVRLMFVCQGRIYGYRQANVYVKMVSKRIVKANVSLEVGSEHFAGK